MQRMRVVALVALTALIWSAACAKRGDRTSAEVRAAIAAAIHDQHDSITITDPTTGSAVRVAFDHVHDKVETTAGGRYFACADFRSAAGPVYDVDYYVARRSGKFTVEDIVLHELGGKTVIADSTRARLASAP
jgi:hypothetical protein